MADNDGSMSSLLRRRQLIERGRDAFFNDGCPVCGWDITLLGGNPNCSTCAAEPPSQGFGEDPEELCDDCGHDTYEGHDMRSSPPACYDCPCGHELAPEAAVAEEGRLAGEYGDDPEPAPEVMAERAARSRAIYEEAEHNRGLHDLSEPSYADRCPVCFYAVTGQEPGSPAEMAAALAELER